MAIVTSRYARAFADVISDMKLNPQQVQQQVQGYIDLLRDNVELRRVFDNPAIPAEQKHSLLDALVSRAGTMKPVRNFFAVLIDHRRMPQLEEIFRIFQHELNERMGLAEADVVSARSLADDEKREIESQVMRITGKRVQAKYSTDPGLIGGALVKIGSTIYDGSVRGQLQKIREALSS